MNELEKITELEKHKDKTFTPEIVEEIENACGRIIDEENRKADELYKEAQLEWFEDSKAYNIMKQCADLQKAKIAGLHKIMGLERQARQLSEDNLKAKIAELEKEIKKRIAQASKLIWDLCDDCETEKQLNSIRDKVEEHKDNSLIVGGNYARLVKEILKDIGEKE